MKDLIYKRIMAYVNYLVLFVDDESTQNQIVNKLKEYNNKLPDGKWIDKLQDRFLAKKTNYFDIAEALIKDIEKTKRNDKNLKIIQELLGEIESIVNPKVETKKTEQTPAKKIADLSSWS